MLTKQKGLYWERRLEIVKTDKGSEELLCQVACSLSFYGNEVSFQLSLTYHSNQGPPW